MGIGKGWCREDSAERVCLCASGERVLGEGADTGGVCVEAGTSEQGG